MDQTNAAEQFANAIKAKIRQMIAQTIEESSKNPKPNN
jgi:hypothetical protein